MSKAEEEHSRPLQVSISLLEMLLIHMAQNNTQVAAESFNSLLEMPVQQERR